MSLHVASSTRIPVLWLLAVSALGTLSCSALQAEVDFNREIRPLLAEFCLQCHGPDASQRAADLRLDIEEQAKAAIANHQAADSELVIRIYSTDPDSIMPPPSTGKELTRAQKQLLTQWITEGAKYSNHWAFEPIRSASDLLSELATSNAQERTVDRFLLDKLAAVGLSYSQEVSRTQFIRRASFDLIGLPPTWEEVEAYLNDEKVDATERLIDRLLESPRYGERWGRHWLDIARYADTHGGAAIGFTAFPFSYTYRDYVIQGFNQDKAFDRFIVEQIAADQLGLAEDDPVLAALGFLTVGMQFRNYHDTIDDQIDVITRGLMGLTVTCARCHDHKFDPIPTTDYYALYSVIAASKSPPELPTIGGVADEATHQAYQDQLASLKVKLDDFVRDQSEIMRGRLRMQVGLYLGEIAKGMGEQDVSTQFLSYRTDDIRPIVLNRWLDYIQTLSTNDPVFGPWIEMQSWDEQVGETTADSFQTRASVYIAKLKSELEASGSTADKQHALREEPPKWNPMLLEALENRKPSSLHDVAEVYGKVFVDAQRQWLESLLAASDEASSADKIVPDDHPQHLVINSPAHRQLRHHLYSARSPCDLPDEVAMGLTNRTISDLINAKRGAIHQLDLSSPGAPPRAMIVREDPSPKASFVFTRGNPLSRGERVQAGFLSILPEVEPGIFHDGKRRLGLARAITSASNPLTSRVIVNWAWRHHFGVGLVRSPDDFGTRGEPPTHPELLDYLADAFRANGWSIKWLHREIMLSKAYRQGALESEASRQVDPDNQLLWRMPRRRLDFEAMRDAMLAVSSELDATMGGRPVDLNASPAIPRRSVYGFINRDIIANLMSTFDTANPNACTAKRPDTSVPQQTLFALNSDFIQDRAKRLAEWSKQHHAASDEERIVALVQSVLGRMPTRDETDRAKQFLHESATGSDSKQPDREQADIETQWIQFAHALLASNEFMFLD